jgi:hypothetical protein
MAAAVAKTNDDVIVVVPFRDLGDGVRAAQLRTFLDAMGDFHVVVVEQSNDGAKFNRGSLLNVGSRIAGGNISSTTTFIFHDVDLVPSAELKRMYHERPATPGTVIHYGASFRRYPSPSYLGGCVAVNALDFRDKVNGFSNLFWGWGGEDDDFRERLRSVRLQVQRVEGESYVDLEDMSLVSKLQYLRDNPALKCRDKWECRDAARLLGIHGDGASTLQFVEVEHRPRISPRHEHVVVDLSSVRGKVNEGFEVRRSPARKKNLRQHTTS